MLYQFFGFCLCAKYSFRNYRVFLCTPSYVGPIGDDRIVELVSRSSSGPVSKILFFYSIPYFLKIIMNA